MSTMQQPQPQWECYLCAKKNDESEREACACCKRPRSYAPKSFIDRAKAQPLALHGVATGQHAFRPEQFEALVRGGLDIGARDTLGWTALHCAARTGDDRVVSVILESDTSKILLEAATQPGGWRALHYAVAAGHLAVTEELLAADADVDAQTGIEGLTPLHLAAEHGRDHIMDLLLQCGANTNLVTVGLRRTPLHVAGTALATPRDVPCLPVALTAPPPTAAFAVDSRSPACVRMLLAKTDLVRVQDAGGMSPLQLAHLLPREPKSGDVEELIKLLEAHQHHYDRTPLLSPFLRDAVA